MSSVSSIEQGSIVITRGSFKDFILHGKGTQMHLKLKEVVPQAASSSFAVLEDINSVQYLFYYMCVKIFERHLRSINGLLYGSFSRKTDVHMENLVKG